MMSAAGTSEAPPGALASADGTAPASPSAPAPGKTSKKPRYSKFTQQELPACRPLLTPNWVIFIFFIVGVIFIPIGAAALAASRKVVETSTRYDDRPECFGGSQPSAEGFDTILEATGGEGTTCSVTLTVPKEMKPPIFFYYQLENFYQNHRRYVKSRNDKQLKSDNPTGASVSGCEPEDYEEKVINGTLQRVKIFPCGLVAWSYFNDTYALSAGGAALPVSEKGIAWSSDVNDKFSSADAFNFNDIPAERGGGNITGPINQDEHFIVWMRTAALPKFRKLWGRIDNATLAAGQNVTVFINNRYNTYRFSGKKSVVLSTTSWIGGKNDFLGIAYLTVGSLCAALGLAFLLLHLTHPRKLGDLSYVNWNKGKSGGGGGGAGASANGGVANNVG
eukprot:jgi/Chlat1/409/Chrsp10S01530